MAELSDLFREFLEKDGESNDLRKDMESAHKIFLPEGDGRRMHEMSIRWTMHSVFSYGMALMGKKVDQDERKKWAHMMRACTDHLIANKEIRNENKVPNIDWFQTLVACKDGSDS